ncbi:MAG: lamin tail domain-containing protein [Planctomycetota bacterium]
MHTNTTLAAALALAAGGTVNAQVIITEILANEIGGDTPGEWVEIYNAGGNAVDISGWRLADEDSSSPSEPFPDGFMIMPGEAVVVIGDGFSDTDPGEPVIVENDFFASWGATNADGNSYRVIVQREYITLANTASPTNEVLTLIDAAGNTVDVANYENGSNGWPPTTNGASISLSADFLNDLANDFGCAWATSLVGVNGAVSSFEVIVGAADGTFPVALSADNVASPGFVATGGTFVDCNNNGFNDALDICNGVSVDCNGNGIPDECEPDCNGNGIADTCDIEADFSIDGNLNQIIDSCEIAADPSLDLNGDGTLDIVEQFQNQAIITEIMFDPFTSGEEMEYVEILNTTGAPLDISGWFLQDIEFNGEGPTDAIPAGTVLPAGGIAVLTRSVTGDVNETRQDYIDAWGATTPAGDPILWIPLENWGARATFGTEVTEVLSIVSSAGTVVDTVNYINRTSNSEPLPGGWPGGDGHGSYFLDGTKLNGVDNDLGPNWQRSTNGLSGVYRSNDFDPADLPSWTIADRGGEDYGTPGFVFAGAPQEPSGDVVITEIAAVGGAVFPGQDPMDLMSDEGIDEWVEIYNASGAPIDISGWYLEDEDGRTSALPAGSMLDAGEVAVIYGGADFPTEIPSPADSFYDAWGCGYQLFVVSEWYTSNKQFGLSRLSDSPNFVNEILRLVDATGTPVDLVNYDDDAFVWPVDSTGVATDNNWSIYILPPQSNYNSTDNDDGVNWADSLEPIDDARTILAANDVFNALGEVYGSPGALTGVQIPDLSDCPATGRLCADQNGDGNVNPGDFNAWVINFNAGDLRADVNGNEVNDPGDFNAWIAAFNLGPAGPTCNP